jgi:DsbC/DsbD-like thiol-disulfide interchange protein
MKYWIALACFVVASPAFAQKVNFDDVVMSITAKAEPATAKRGETVKWTLQIELADGWHSYPTKQPDERNDSFVNKIAFPKPGDIVFVGELKEPPAKVRVESDGSKISEVEGKPAWMRPFVVNPKAKPGKTTISVPVTISVCDKNMCLPPKKITVDVELTITDAAPVKVDPKYEKEIK